MAITYKIYPPIGVARLGRSNTAFYVGPERCHHLGVEIDPAGNETDVRGFKDAQFQHKRQAARFRIFEFEDGAQPGKPFEIPNGAQIEWSVELAKVKDAVTRPFLPPPQPTRPNRDPGRVERAVTPNLRTISGESASGIRLDTGTYLGTPVDLGEIRTDADQNLLMLGAGGFSQSPLVPPAPITSFYNNPGWFDDVADGPVRAKIILSDGSEITEISPSWVIVGPPAYAPEIHCAVTLFDVVRQVGIDLNEIVLPNEPSFSREIYPLINRASLLRWVHDDDDPHNSSDELWGSIDPDWARLSDPGATQQALRTEMANVVRSVERAFSSFRLTGWQLDYLRKWEAGEFDSDWNGIPVPATDVTPEEMLRAALEPCTGQGFFPGIEAGIILTDPSIYSSPFEFRPDHAQLNPGDITALMALPWQADFFDCRHSWWPTQRPDKAVLAQTGEVKKWARGVDGHHDMIADFWRLGVIQSEPGGTRTDRYVEVDRDPQLR